MRGLFLFTMASPSFATGAVDSPPRLINTRPVSKGLHYKEVRDGRDSSERGDVILGELCAGSSSASCMSFRQRSVTYVKSFLRAFTREKRYPTCFKFRFVSSPPEGGSVSTI